MTGLAINAHPAVPSPNPLLRLFFFRQGVIDAVDAPDHELAICNFMQSTCGVFAGPAINDQLADFKRLLLAGICTDFHGSPLA